MAIGDIDIMRIPIEIDPNGTPDVNVVTIAAAKYTVVNYAIPPSVQIVRDPGVNTTKAVLVLAGRKSA